MGKLIDQYMLELVDAKFTTQQIKVVRTKMLDYALSACMDSEIRKEIIEEIRKSQGSSV